MLKIAIVGCGKVADQHMYAIHRIPDCEIVALCDRELLMAKQLGERFGISKCFSDLQEMLQANQPDIVHITTPPQSHYLLAKQCLESGCHVYVEKPFTLYTSEAEQLIALAERRGLKLTVGHDGQFSHAARRMRGLIRSGYPGGLLQNLISHGLAKIAEFLATDIPEVIAVAFASSFLTRFENEDLVDELRVIITEKEGTTAYFTFSS